MSRKILYSVGVILVVLLSILAIDYFNYSQKQNQEILALGQLNSDILRDQVNEILQDVMDETHRIAAEVTHNNPDKIAVESLISKSVRNNDQLLGASVSYEPYGYDVTTNLYSPYYDKNKNDLIYLEDVYDYTDKNLKSARWYTDLVASGKSAWIEPYYGQAADTFISDYGVPFYFIEGPNKGKVRGVVTMTISLKGFQDLIHSLSLGKTGYGFVISQKGMVLAHPIMEYVGTKNITTIIKEETDGVMKKAYQSLLEGSSGNLEFIGNNQKDPSLFFYDQVPAASWNIGVIFYKKDMLTGGLESKRKFINIVLVISLLLFVLLAIFYNRDSVSVSEIWYLSYFASVVLIVNILLLGYLQHSLVLDSSIISEREPIIDNATLNNFVINQKKYANTHKKHAPKIVPIGIYIERMEFKDSYNINISGVVWQQFDTTWVKKVTPGFKFPQIAPFAEAEFIEESTREIIGNQVLIHYDFRTTLRLNFDYSDYPFDKRNIDLEIHPVHYKDNLLFIPDLSSYDYTTPSKKGGVNPTIKLSGDEILESYFNYSFKSYATDFGYYAYDYFDKTPLLHYNINIKRMLITSFITYLIPVFVTLIMIFILITATNKPKVYGDGTGIVQGMAAFFFVLIFSHIDLRKDIDTGELIYMEYFYFIAYIFIIAATYNLITYTRRPNRFFDYKDNVIVKAVFWPSFLTMVLLITLLKFY